MKSKYKYIHFIETDELVNGRKVWECKNNRTKAILAKLFYYKQWKQYCFTQYEQGVIFNDGCLADTIDFIKQLQATQSS